MGPLDLKRLAREDIREEQELRNYELSAMIADGLIEPRPRRDKDGQRRTRPSGMYLISHGVSMFLTLAGTTDLKRRRNETDVQSEEHHSTLQSQDHRMEQDGH